MYINRILVTVLSLIATFATLGTPRIAAAHPEVFYQLIVQGGPDADGINRLKLFYQRLLVELGVSDLGEANIGCDKCLELDSGDVEQFLTFALEREGLQLPAFVLSYDFVQKTYGYDLFTLELNGQPPAASGDCPIPLPSGCAPRPICISTSRCDKPYGGACAVCPIVP